MLLKLINLMVVYSLIICIKIVKFNNYKTLLFIKSYFSSNTSTILLKSAAAFTTFLYVSNTSIGYIKAS